MDLKQSELDYIKRRLELGEITLDEANLEMVLSRRVLLVTSKLPADIRRVLNAAVKAGRLGHMKKDGPKPEAYFHPNFDYMAKAERSAHMARTIEALHRVCC